MDFFVLFSDIPTFGNEVRACDEGLLHDRKKYDEYDGIDLFASAFFGIDVSSFKGG